MDPVVSALSDEARWQILELLARRPRSVGEVAELTGTRQPQATKHLQALARAGLATVYPLGQRRVYALESAPLVRLQEALGQLVETARAHGSERDVVARYSAAIAEDTAAAKQARWADGRAFGFKRLLPAPPEVVWRHWVEPPLMATWLAPPSLRLTECALEPRAGGLAVLEYRDAEARYRAEGRVHSVKEPSALAWALSVLDAQGQVMFTAHYQLALARAADGTRLALKLRIADSTVASAPYIAGIETGWGQVLDQLVRAIAAFGPAGRPVRRPSIRRSST